MGLRLRWVKIHQFRDVAPGTELHFSDGWNVIVGRNGTGKTTLLEVVSTLFRGAFFEWKDEQFSVEALFSVDGRLGLEWRMRAKSVLPSTLYVNAESKSVLEVDFRLHGNVREVGVTLRSGERPVVKPVGIKEPMASETDWWGMSAWFAVHYLDDPELLVSTSGLHSVRVDEAIAYFGSLTGRTASEGLLPYYLPPFLVMTKKTVSGVGIPVRAKLFAGQPGADLVYSLNPLLLQIGTKLCPLVDADSLEGFAVARSANKYEDFAFYLVRQGTAYHHDSWSFGQKRLFAFYWYLALEPDAVIADELVNGFHWEWIDACVKEIGDRQVFVTAQNPLLLDHIEVSSAEQAKKTFVMCRAEKDADGKRLLRWTQPDDKQAQDFMDAYNVGIQYVSEILKTQGLW